MEIPARLSLQAKLAAERRSYVNGSFGSSGALLTEAAKFLIQSPREKLCLMKFHQDWQHEDCPVMKWYSLQNVPGSSTKFRSIEHRRDSEAPYFHEFLLIKLTDGATCRVERTGQGSRVDAVRIIGCDAQDYIQYFLPTKYESSIRNSRPSELVAKIDFPRDLDIMDVLAVCYAVYKRGRTRKYTVQRFNCYFLCGAILLALTRRFVRWEATVTLDAWQDAINKVLAHVEKRARDPNNTDLVFLVCHHIEPASAQPAEFILKALRDRLGTEPTYISLKQALADNLWRSSWSAHRDRAIAQHINSAIAIAISGDSDCAKVFHSAIHDGKRALQEKHETFAIVHKIFNKKATGAMYDSVRALKKASEEQYRLEKIERPSSIFRDAWVAVVSSAVGVWFPIQLLCSDDMEEWGFKELMLSSTRGILAGQRIAKLQSRRLYGMTAPEGPTVEVANNMRIDSAATMQEDMAQTNYMMAARSLGETLQALSEQGILTVPNITLALHETLCKNVWDDWLNRSFRQLLRDFLPDMLKEEEEGVLVEIPGQDGPIIEIKSIAKYQEYMRKRVQDHAKRIETFRLASASLKSIFDKCLVPIRVLLRPADDASSFSSPILQQKKNKALNTACKVLDKLCLGNVWLSAGPRD
ncbi:unnamed protein product [Rhizoctonia solani]|uniref:Uncharacterized protein n=1 Tax=Rhizoctonia solani TaxID=456999 RepID=A0A8H3BQJ5_9AGAM|nr:unnamed protein product [Rhizoctonia solani]